MMNENKRWQKLYDYLEGVLKGFLDDASREHIVNPSPKFLLDLMPANGNLGEALLRRNIVSDVRLYLDGVEKVGAPGVGVQIQYPLLDAEIMGQYAVDGYLRFYEKVAEEVRRRGLLLYAETSPVFSGTRFSNLVISYAGMTPAEYVQRRVAQAQMIADVLEPDYLSLAHEVSTERLLTGLDVTDAQMVAALSDMNFWHTGTTRIGGGLPAWEDNSSLTEQYGQAGDFYTAHLYPIKTGLREDAGSQLHDLFWALRGLPTNHEKIIGETWLYKATAFELLGGSPMERADRIYARDMYAIWDPLDALFLQAIHLLAQVAGISYVNLFWSRHCFAYATDSRADEAQLNRDVMTAIRAGALTQTGQVCRQLNG